MSVQIDVDFVAFLNTQASVTTAADGSLLLQTGGDGFLGSLFTLTAEGQILVDGVPYAGSTPAPVTPTPPAYIAPTLLNGWKNHGDTPQWKQSVAGYRKHDDGTVELTGLVDGTATGTNIFNLPVGYRPANQKAIPVCCSANGDAIAFLKIQPNGNVLLSTGAPTFIFLTGVRFSLT